MKILITGGAGFIGSQVGLYLDKKGYEVIPLDNLAYGYIHNFIENKNLLSNFLCMDILDPKLEDVMKGVDVVFHLAGYVSLPGCNDNPMEAYRCNVAGTANVLEMARRNGVRKIIFSSTAAVYENETVLPFSEFSKPYPTLIYAQTKKAAEDLCKSYIKMYGIDITILRFFNVYGPHMDYRPPSYLISYVIQSLLQKEKPILHSNGKQARDFIYVSDVARLCEIVMTHPKAKHEIFNVGSGKTVTVQEIVEFISKLLGEKSIQPVFRDPKLIWERFPRQFEGKYPLDQLLLEKEVNKRTLAATKKTKEILNWQAKIGIYEGLSKTIEYVKTVRSKKELKN